MKNGLLLALFIAALLAVFFWGKSCGRSELPVQDNSEQIRELMNKVAASVKGEDSLAVLDSLKGLKIDSLSFVIASITKKTEIKRREIDLEIAKDSANSIGEYRKSLRNLEPMIGFITGNGPLTFLEVGTGAKYLSGIPGMQLTINKYQGNEVNFVERLKIKDQRLSEKDFQLAGKDDLITMHEANEEYYKKQFDNTKRFFYHRFGFYAGVGGNYDGKTMSPGIQLGVGILIWRNE